MNCLIFFFLIINPLHTLLRAYNSKQELISFSFLYQFSAHPENNVCIKYNSFFIMYVYYNVICVNVITGTAIGHINIITMAKYRVFSHNSKMGVNKLFHII